MSRGSKLGLSGVVLAGGRSERFGTDKALVEIHGEKLIERVLRTLDSACEEVFVSANTQDYAYLGYPVVEDAHRGAGPLGGIESALRNSSHEKIVVVACDMPFVKPEFIRLLWGESEGVDVVMPRTNDGLEPLCALYSKTCLPLIERNIHHSRFKVIDFLPEVRTRILGCEEWGKVDPEGLSLLNINTPEELRRASELVGRD